MKMGRHGRYVKRTAAFLLSAVLAAGLLSGCGKGKTEEQNKENTSVKGRYVAVSYTHLTLPTILLV